MAGQMVEIRWHARGGQGAKTAAMFLAEAGGLMNRSARLLNAIRELENLFGFENLYNLKGGILAWANEIDNSVPTY